MAKTIVALYDEFDAARRVVQELVDNGFSREDISLLASDARGEFARYHQTDQEEVSRGEEIGISAGAGAAVGGLGGLLIGLGLLPVPGIGPALAAGPIAAALAGAGIGAAAGGLSSALFGMGVPEREAGYYAEGVRRGGTLVILSTADDALQQATEIMHRHNPVDIDQRVEQWRARGWTGYDPQARPYTAEEIEREREHHLR